MNDKIKHLGDTRDRESIAGAIKGVPLHFPCR
jgi:hypothetical protein